MIPKSFRERSFLHFLCLVFAVTWLVSAINPIDRQDWLIENFLVFISVPILVVTYRRLPLSNTAYVFTLLFFILHLVGAHYTYVKVPFGFWLQHTFDFHRNHYDRIVHFAFGFLLCYPLSEILVRTVRPRSLWSVLLPVSLILAGSGFFEIVEAIVAMIVNPDLGAAYLGTQGDPWDAQQDIGLAGAGAILATPFALWLCARFRTPVPAPQNPSK